MAYAWYNLTPDRWSLLTEQDWYELLIDGGETDLAGSIIGTSTLSGVLSSNIYLVGSINGSGNLYSTLLMPSQNLTGNISGSGFFEGFLNIYHSLAGEINGVGGLSGLLTVETFKDLTLFICGNNPYNDNIPLFIAGYNGQTVNAAIPLYLYNAAVTDYIPLLIEGSGENEGYIPFSDCIPLFIGDHNKVYNDIQLFLQGYTGENSGIVPLYVYGGYTIDASVDLVLPNIYGNAAGKFKLYVRGY